MLQLGNNWDHGLQAVARSDVGLRRGNNQDSLATALASSVEKWQARGHLFVVADGMGAHAAGELASKLATDTVPLVYNKLRDLAPPEALRTAVAEANLEIHRRGQASEDFRGMGTTASALVLLPQGAVTAQVGDSRVYRWRADRLEQLTFDHSLVWEMRAAGQISGEDGIDFIPRNIITRSLGPNPEVQIDLEGIFPIQPGDIYLLCSDGLSGQVQDEEIGKILGCMEPEEAVDALVHLANLRGGPDNITAIVVRVARIPDHDGRGRGPSSSTGAVRRPVNPMISGLTGLFALGALALLMAGYLLAAFVSLLAMGISGAVAAWQRYSEPPVPTYEFDGKPLGRGPYAAWECKPDQSFADRLSGIAEELREAAQNERWMVDWNHFNMHCNQAYAAAHLGDYCKAVSEYCRAISFMMSELRNQRRRSHSGDAGAAH